MDFSIIDFNLVQSKELRTKNRRCQEPKKEYKRKPGIKERIQKIIKSQSFLNYRSL